MAPWNPARTKVQIKLSIQRLRTLQEKKLALAKKSRREIADLLLKNRVETARLRVEGLIGDDIYVELLELLELYSETLNARFNLLDAGSGTEPEASISDAVCAVVYAAPRTELKELQVLREMLMHKYGRQWSLALQETNPPSSTVPARVVSKLALYTPSRELVDAYLYEIARGYGVNWAPEPPQDSESSEPTDNSQSGDNAETKEQGGDVKPTDEDEEEGESESIGGKGVDIPTKSKTKADNKAGSPKDGAVATPPSYPAGQEKDAWAGTTPPSGSVGAGVGGAGTGGGGGRKLTEEEELAKRFERLKNLK